MIACILIPGFELQAALRERPRVGLKPAAQACCGVCRSCMTTNIFTLAAAGLVTLAAYAKRLVRPA